MSPSPPPHKPPDKFVPLLHNYVPPMDTRSARHINIGMKEIAGYSYVSDISEGGFGIVYKAVEKKTNTEVAIKSIARKNMSEADLDNEIKILMDLTTLKHDNLVRLLDLHKTPTHVFLIMEYCNYGTLFTFLWNDQSKQPITIDEPVIRHFFSHISRAMEVLNNKSIAHRDLKPQNILLCNPQRLRKPHATQLIAKLADFGISRRLPNGLMTQTSWGTPPYMAPEVLLNEPYDARADLWALGVIIYECLTTKIPFVNLTPHTLYNKYQMPQIFVNCFKKPLSMKLNIPRNCSPALCDLLVRLLKVNPNHRIGFDEFLKHSFFLPTQLQQANKQAIQLTDSSSRHENVLDTSNPQQKSDSIIILAPAPDKPGPSYSPSSPQNHSALTIKTPLPPLNNRNKWVLRKLNNIVGSSHQQAVKTQLIQLHPELFELQTADPRLRKLEEPEPSSPQKNPTIIPLHTQSEERRQQKNKEKEDEQQKNVEIEKKNKEVAKRGAKHITGQTNEETTSEEASTTNLEQPSKKKTKRGTQPQTRGGRKLRENLTATNNITAPSHQYGLGTAVVRFPSSQQQHGYNWNMALPSMMPPPMQQQGYHQFWASPPIPHIHFWAQQSIQAPPAHQHGHFDGNPPNQ